MNVFAIVIITFIALDLACAYQVDSTCDKDLTGGDLDVGLRFKASPWCNDEAPKSIYFLLA